MLRGTKQMINQAAVRRTVQLMVFSVGGKAFAVNANEVTAVVPWPTSMRVPSTTPNLNEVVRRGNQVTAVYDLAEPWSLSVDRDAALCLVVKWGSTDAVVRVDSQIPSLETAETDMISSTVDRQPGLVGMWQFQGIEIPLVSFRQMGQSHKAAV